jgi:hypothetical protein
MPQIIPTGNVNRDISSVMDQLNTINDGTSNLNGLTVVSFGTIFVNYPGGAFSKIVQTSHNLGYTPFFLARAVTYPTSDVTSPSQVADSLVVADYGYLGSGPKLNSGYPESFTQFVATPTTFGVVFVDVGAVGATAAGLYGFQYYLFTRPIGANS